MYLTSTKEAIVLKKCPNFDLCRQKITYYNLSFVFKNVKITPEAEFEKLVDFTFYFKPL